MELTMSILSLASVFLALVRFELEGPSPFSARVRVEPLPAVRRLTGGEFNCLSHLRQ